MSIIAADSTSGNSSTTGTMMGGSLTIRRWPSTTWVSLSSAVIESLLCALATSLDAVFAILTWAFVPCAAAWVFKMSAIGSTSTRLYHTSRLFIMAIRRIDSR